MAPLLFVDLHPLPLGEACPEPVEGARPVLSGAEGVRVLEEPVVGEDDLAVLASFFPNAQSSLGIQG
jgi:hypothetical protein